MSGIDKVADLAADNGWMELQSASPRLRQFFKWGPNMTRIEVHLVVDAMGRIEAVSVWHNQRQSIAHQPGVRAKAERILRGAAS